MNEEAYLDSVLGLKLTLINILTEGRLKAKIQFSRFGKIQLLIVINCTEILNEPGPLRCVCWSVRPCINPKHSCASGCERLIAGRLWVRGWHVSSICVDDCGALPVWSAANLISFMGALLTWCNSTHSCLPHHRNSSLPLPLPTALLAELWTLSRLTSFTLRHQIGKVNAAC